MAEKATEVWKRIHNNAFPDGLIAQIQRIHDLNHARYPVLDSGIHALGLVAQNALKSDIQALGLVAQNALTSDIQSLGLAAHNALTSDIQALGLVARSALNQGIYDVSHAAASSLQFPLLSSYDDWKQFSQSIVALAEEFKDIVPEIHWEPSDELTDSINCTLQEAASFQKEIKAEIPSELSTKKPLPKDYIKTNIWNILAILLNIISILLYFAPNPIEETTLKNQQNIVTQNQQIIEQNNKQLQLDRERNELLQKLCDTVQAIDDETGILGEQSDSIVEQDDDFEQSLDSPRNEDAAESEQQ